MVGDGGTILRTTDGGANWTKQSSGRRCRSMVFYSPMPALGGGWSSGSFFAQQMGGTNGQSDNWNNVRSQQRLFHRCNTGTAVGGGYPNATILHTTNGGVNWTSQPNPAIILSITYVSRMPIQEQR